MFTKILTLALAVLVGGAVSANGQSQGRGNQGRGNAKAKEAAIRFQAMDTNNDRVITRAGMARQRAVVHGARLERRRQARGNEVRVGATRDDRAWDRE